MRELTREEIAAVSGGAENRLGRDREVFGVSGLQGGVMVMGVTSLARAGSALTPVGAAIGATLILADVITGFAEYLADQPSTQQGTTRPRAGWVSGG
jgi:hypothetical protein